MKYFTKTTEDKATLEVLLPPAAKENFGIPEKSAITSKKHFCHNLQLRKNWAAYKEE